MIKFSVLQSDEQISLFCRCGAETCLALCKRVAAGISAPGYFWSGLRPWPQDHHFPVQFFLDFLHIRFFRHWIACIIIKEIIGRLSVAIRKLLHTGKKL